MLWILFAVIVLGNSAVLVTMHLNSNQKSRMNFFIKQLAIAGKCNYRRHRVHTCVQCVIAHFPTAVQTCASAC